MERTKRWVALGFSLCAAACTSADDATVDDATSDAGTSSAGEDGGTPSAGGDAGDAGSGATGSTGTVSTDAGVACATLSAQQARVACAANALLATLSSSQLSALSFELDDYVSRSLWSNLPVQMKPRAGTPLSGLSDAQRAAVLDLMTIALNDLGYSTMAGIMAADDYIGTMAGGYGSGLYSIAIFGTPSADGDFEVMFGGHHMAFNLHFVSGSFYPVPQHLGAEPKSTFEYAGTSYAPMATKGDAMFAAYAALDASQQASAYLTGQTFSDVLVSPDLDYGKGASRGSKGAYPTGANRKGVLVSTMTESQQALVTKAIEQWVRQYPSELADALMDDYESEYTDTYFAWAGSASGPDKDVSGSYLRVDGPRVWIELVVQGGIVIRGETHYHTIFHDKSFDYGGQF